MGVKIRVALLVLLMAVCFAAGAYAADDLQKVEAFLRPDFQIQLNGVSVATEEPPLVYEGRTYLQLRSVALLLGAEIDWNANSRMILIQTDVEDENGNSGGNGEGENSDQAGTDSGTTGTGGPEPEEIPKDGSVSPEEDVSLQEETIRFESMQQFKMEYGEEEYEIVSNNYGGAVYFRLSDLEELEIDWRDLRAWKEEETGQLFVLASDLEKRLDGEPLFELMEVPVVTGDVSENEKERLQNQYRSAHYVRYIEEEDWYEVLYVSESGVYARYVEFDGSSRYGKFREKIDFYEEDEEDEEDDN